MTAALAAAPALLSFLAAILQGAGDSQFGPITHEGVYTREVGGEFLYILRKPELRYGAMVVTADRAILYLDADEYVRRGREGFALGDPLRPGPQLPVSGARDFTEEARRAAELVRGPMPISRDPIPFLRALRAIYFEGDVRIRQGSDRSATASAALIDVAAQRLILVESEVRVGKPKAGRPTSVVVRAEAIRQELPGAMRASDADVTSCDLTTPHFHIRSKELALTPVSPEEVTIEGSGNSLEFSEIASVPIPDFSLYSSDLKFFPLEGVSFGHSRRDGTFTRIRFGRDFKDLGNSVNRSLGIDGDFKGHWSLELGALSRRGPEVTGTVDYETPGVYRGRTTAFFLSDRGSDVGFLSDVYQEHEPNRSRVWSINRIYAGSDRSWLDAEIAASSDSLLRPEFMPRELKTEKRPETLLYYRTASDSASFTALAKTELNSFEPIVTTGVTPGGTPPSVTNSYPFLDGRIQPMPIATLPVPGGLAGDSRDLELVYRGRIDAGYLERQFSEADFITSLVPAGQVDPLNQRAGRFDTIHEISTPFSLGVANFVPFVSARQTSATASNTAGTPATGPGTSENDADRLLTTIGAKIGSHLEGQLGSVGHVIDATVSYQNVSAPVDGDKDEDFIPFDAVDLLRPVEVFTLDFRNRFTTRDADTGRLRTFADLHLGIPYYPRADRDNAGDDFGPLRTDARLDFANATPIPGLRFRHRSLFETQTSDMIKSDTSVTSSPFGPQLDMSVAYRQSDSLYEAVSLGLSYHISQKWDLDVSEQYDFVERRAISQHLALRRYAHDWALELRVSYDINDNNFSVTVAFLPFAGPGDRPRDYYVTSEPTFRGFY